MGHKWKQIEEILQKRNVKFHKLPTLIKYLQTDKVHHKHELYLM